MKVVSIWIWDDQTVRWVWVAGNDGLPSTAGSFPIIKKEGDTYLVAFENGTFQQI